MAHVRLSDHLVFRIRTILSHYQTILAFIVQQLHLDTRYVLCICNYFGNSLRTISNFFCCTKILSSLVCSNANCGRGFKYLIRLANIKIELRNTASWWRRTSSFCNCVGFDADLFSRFKNMKKMKGFAGVLSTTIC